MASFLHSHLGQIRVSGSLVNQVNSSDPVTTLIENCLHHTTTSTHLLNGLKNDLNATGQQLDLQNLAILQSAFFFRYTQTCTLLSITQVLSNITIL